MGLKVLLAKHSWLCLFAALLLLSVWRLCAREAIQMELFFDEAYYWGWAQAPAWGYYSKPPVLAWIISLTTALLGDSEFALRLGSAVLYPATALVIFALARRLFMASAQRDLIALAGGITFISLPVIGFGSWFMTTDAPLLFFWSLALLSYVAALGTNSWGAWLGLGAALGLGMLSKYSMVFFGVCMLLHLSLSNEIWRQLRNSRLWVAVGLALFIWSPNLWWNASNDFASYRHTAEISQLDHASFNFKHMLEFVAAQFGLFGFILSVGLLWALLRTKSLWRDARLKLLACFSFTPLVLFAGLAFTSRAFANWAAFSYVAAALLIAALWVQQARCRLLLAGISLNVALLAVLMHWHSIAPILGITLSAKTDPYYRVSGWRGLGEQLIPLLEQYPHARLLGDSRDTLAEMSFYAGRQTANGREPLIYNPTGAITNHYALVADISNHPQGEFIWVTKEDVTSQASQLFAQARHLTLLTQTIYPGKARQLHVWWVKDYHQQSHNSAQKNAASKLGGVEHAE